MEALTSHSQMPQLRHTRACRGYLAAASTHARYPRHTQFYNAEAPTSPLHPPLTPRQHNQQRQDRNAQRRECGHANPRSAAAAVQ